MNSPSINILLICCYIIIINNSIFAEKICYSGYRVYKVNPLTQEQVNILKEEGKQSDGFKLIEEPRIILKDVFVLVKPNKVEQFLLFLLTHQIQFELLDINAQSKLDRTLGLKPIDGSYGWEEYHELEETYSFLEQLAENYPQVQVITIGHTYENRPIKGVKISYKPDNKIVFIEAGVIAREWISPVTATFIINQLLTSQDPDIRTMAENFDWYIIPHANPDGYVYSRKNDPLWRKTRSKNGECYGVDPNCNWDSKWNESNESGSSCMDTYAGPSAFSEIETKSLSTVIASIADDIVVYISLQANSEGMISPLGSTSDHAYSYDESKKISDGALQSLKKRFGDMNNSVKIYGHASTESSVDWVYANFPIPIACKYELRLLKKTWYDFAPAASFIKPIGQEALNSLVALLNEMNDLHFFDIKTI